MALSLILRNSLKAQASTKCQSHLLKCLAITPIQYNRNFSVTPARHIDHGKLWAVEKAVSVALLGIMPLALAAPNPVLDNLLAVACVSHFHWGLEACVIDYIRPIIFGPVIPQMSIIFLYVISGATLGGLLYYNMNDIGIGKTVRKIWEITE